MSLWVRIPLGDVMRFEPIIVKKCTQPNFYGFSWVQLGGTAVSPIELLIGKQYCFAVVKKKLR